MSAMLDSGPDGMGLRRPNHFGAVLNSFPGAGAPVRGNRLTFDNAVFPEPLPDAAPTF